MSPTLTTFVFELANFLLLAALLGWLLFKPVRARLEERHAAERERAATLAAQEKALAAERAALDARHSASSDDIARLRKERLARAEEEAASIVSRAREAAERERERSQRLLAHVERAQMDRLSMAVSAAARDAVARLLTTLHSIDLDQALLQAVCREVEKSGEAPGPVVVESAAPLEASARTALSTAAGARAASIDFRVVPDLGAGLRVTTASGLIDASASGIAAHAERVLVEKLTRADREVVS